MLEWLIIGLSLLSFGLGANLVLTCTQLSKSVHEHAACRVEYRAAEARADAQLARRREAEDSMSKWHDSYMRALGEIGALRKERTDLQERVHVLEGKVLS